MQAAWLRYEEKIFCARGTFEQNSPFSAITELIQGIYRSRPQDARRILRNKIHANYEPSEMCRAMVKVTAKRIHSEISEIPKDRDPASVEEIVFRDLTSAAELMPVSTENLTDLERHGPDELMRFALDLASRIPPASTRALSPRPIAALVATADGKILGYAVNKNAINKTLHAETCLVQGFYKKYGKRIPKGSIIYSTLKPCKMCSALILRGSEDPETIKVIYGEDDPGPFARRTALEEQLTRLAP